MKRILIFLFIWIITPPSTASAQVEEAGLIMQRLYKKYDSLHLFKFDVKFTYNSDTAYGDFLYDVLQGKYLMNRGNVKYRLGNIDILQNEHHFVSVYNEQKIIVVSDAVASGSKVLPMRQAIDSMLQVYESQYSVSLSLNIDSTEGEILFTSIDTTSIFTTFKITYDNEDDLLVSLEYNFIGPPQLFRLTDNDSQSLIENGIITSRMQKLKIEFTNYGFEELTPESFLTEQFVMNEDGQWKPVMKYRSYRVFATF